MNPLTKLYTVLFARPMFAKLNTVLFNTALHGLGVLNYQNDDISGERYLLRNWLPKTIKRPKPVFFDVGANVGHYSEMMLKFFPTAFVHAFEPHPINFAHLVKLNFPVDRAKCHNVAVGHTKSSMMLYDHAENDGSQHASLHEATITEFHEHAAVGTQVQVETLDAVALNEGVDYIDFLKIDTEGHELAVLAGASRLLLERKIGCIQFEFNALHVFSRAFFRDFRTVLSNYDFYRLLPNGLLPLDTSITATEIFGFQNILAVPKAAFR